jgi:hypothetical protein
VNMHSNQLCNTGGIRFLVLMCASKPPCSHCPATPPTFGHKGGPPRPAAAVLAVQNLLVLCCAGGVA